MYKTIDFLFSSFVKTSIYGHKLHNKEFCESDIYFVIFIFLGVFIALTVGACCFVLANWGIVFEKYESIFIILSISGLISGAFVYQAKEGDFIENKLATIEPKSEEEMKKYCKHALFTKILPCCTYPVILELICYLLQVFVFHRG
jgi:hypothetical protein